MAGPILPGSAGGAAYEQFRAALALKESGGNPSAIQWDTKARGFFQFIPTWHKKWIKEETGRELDTFMPKDSSQAEMARAKKEQLEVLFPKYYETQLAPFVKNARRAGLGKSYSDADLAAMAHFAGAKGALQFLKTGKDNTAGTVGNAEGGIPEYVKQFREQYLANPIEVLNAATASAKHYGEYGLGRGVYEAFAEKDLPKTAAMSDRNKAIKALYKGSSSPDFTAAIAKGKREAPAHVTINEASRASLQRSTPAQASVFKASPDAAMNENVRILADLKTLRAFIGSSTRDPSEEFMRELRKEGAGV